MLDRERKERCEKRAKEHFADFEALVKEHDGITIIDWRNRNGSGNWAVRYILDGGRLIVTGDLGSAVFERCDPFTVDYCSRAMLSNMFYFAHKCIADGSGISHGGIYEYDKAILEADLDKQLGEWFSDLEDPDDIEELADIRETLLNSRRGMGGIEVSEDLDYRLCKLADGCWDCEDVAALEDCGKEYALFYIAWLTGLEMACKQILDGIAKHNIWTMNTCPKCGVSKYNFFTVVSDDSKPFGKWNYCPGCGADLSGGAR